MENWLFFEHGPQPPAWNMACDEWLLQNINRFDQPILRTYQWDRPSVTIGYFQKFPVDLAAKYTIVRRPTGGALVYHDSDLTFTVVLPKDHLWKKLRPEDRYHKIHERIRKIFELRGAATELAPVAGLVEAGPVSTTPATIQNLPTPSGRSPSNAQCFIQHTRYDVLIGNTKVAGGAQRVTREGLLHQGSIQGGNQVRVSPDELRLTFQTFEITFRDAELSSDDFTQIGVLSEEKYQLPEWNQKV
jgi:lipoate-protein ligase A